MINRLKTKAKNRSGPPDNGLSNHANGMGMGMESEIETLQVKRLRESFVGLFTFHCCFHLTLTTYCIQIRIPLFSLYFRLHSLKQCSVKDNSFRSKSKKKMR